MAYLKTLYGQHYVSDSLDGPWTRREILESRHEERPIMSRRHLREGQDMPMDLTPDELDEVLDELRQFCLRGQGEDGKLTRQETLDHFARLLDQAHEEPDERDDDDINTPEGFRAAWGGERLPPRRRHVAYA